MPTGGSHHRRGRLAAPRPHPDSAPERRTGARQGTLREHNLAIVLERIVTAREPVSRARIAADTGLTRGTVSALVDRLIDARLVSELDPVAGVGAGRPAVPLVPARGTVVALGLEINVDYAAVRAVDLAGETVFERVQPDDFRAGDPARAVTAMLALADEALAHLEETGAQFAGACLALPGLVDRRTGPLRIAPNLRWRDVDVVALVGDHPVAARELWLANEAKLAARAEAAARPDGPDSFLYVSGEVGVGAAVVLGGEIFAGSHGWSGELGHTVVPVEDGAGRRLEELVGQDALMRSAGLELAAGVSGLAAAAEAEDARALAALERAGALLGIGLANAVNVLDLDHVVLGGIYAPLAPWLRPGVEARLREHVIGAPWASVEVSPASAGAFPALTGGALTVLRALVADVQAAIADF